MSLSNPNENGQSNPSARWFDWNGELGTISYYDKETKKSVDVALPFTFILLDQLACVRGWHDASGSGIYSNEVKDTRQEILSVKAFKGGNLVEGIYKDIKDRVNSLGGAFNANCYLAFKDGTNLLMGCLRFKGAALGSWMEFHKQHRRDVFSKAIRVDGFTEGKKGRIVYRVPTFSMSEIVPETITLAVELDRTLQEFLDGYLSRNKQGMAEPKTRTDAPEPGDEGPDDLVPTEAYENIHGLDVSETDVPF